MKYLRISILSRYLLKSYLPSFFTGLFFFSFMILVFYLKAMIKISIENGVPAILVLKLFIYSMGWTLGLSIPMATLLSVIMVVGSLNADSEVIAMRAGGITYPRIMRPFLVWAFFVTCIQIWFNQEIIPLAITGMHQVRTDIANFDPVDLVTKPGQFARLDRTEKSEKHIYVGRKEFDEKQQREVLKTVQIRTIETVTWLPEVTQLITAEEGIKILKKTSDNKEVKALRLFKGYIFSKNIKEKSFQQVDYTNGSLDLNLTLNQDSKRHQAVRDKPSLTFKELNQEIKKIQEQNNPDLNRSLLEFKIEYHKRFALPFATLCLMFLGFPVAIINRRSGKGMGLGISIVFIFIYYVLFLSADSIAVQAQAMPPILAVWLANFVVAMLGCYFLFKRTNDATILEAISDLRARLKKS